MKCIDCYKQLDNKPQYDQYVKDTTDETFYSWLLSEIKLWEESL